MKKIKLKFIGLGLKNKYQAHIIIYDNNSNIIYDGDTYNGFIIVTLNTKTAYIIKATSLGDYIYSIFYVDNENCEYKFIFSRSIYNTNNNIITFLLTDYNYRNLPIEKGELILWPNQ